MSSTRAIKIAAAMLSKICAVYHTIVEDGTYGDV